ncbi:MAG: InlB B-repeat-containing protein [Treponema sp.]|nr:InlB B-repeat-containing protein [Treponema sp.]
MKNRVSIISIILTFFIPFVFFSCADSFNQNASKGKISINLPYGKAIQYNRAGETYVSPVSGDMESGTKPEGTETTVSYTYYVIIENAQKTLSFEKQADSGDSIVFDDLTPGVWTITAAATTKDNEEVLLSLVDDYRTDIADITGESVDCLLYVGKTKSEVIAGEVTNAALSLKRVLLKNQTVEGLKVRNKYSSEKPVKLTEDNYLDFIKENIELSLDFVTYLDGKEIKREAEFISYDALDKELSVSSMPSGACFGYIPFDFDYVYEDEYYSGSVEIESALELPNPEYDEDFIQKKYEIETTDTWYISVDPFGSDYNNLIYYFAPDSNGKDKEIRLYVDPVSIEWYRDGELLSDINVSEKTDEVFTNPIIVSEKEEKGEVTVETGKSESSEKEEVEIEDEEFSYSLPVNHEIAGTYVYKAKVSYKANIWDEESKQFTAAVEKYVSPLTWEWESPEVTVEVTEKYVAPTYYTITFESGIEGVEAVTQSVEENVSTALKANTFVREKYAFKGWSCDGKTYKDGAEIVVTENITLTAIWELIPPTYYTITFESGIEGVEAVTQSVEENVSTALKANTFVREKYAFKGWSCDGKTYKDGAEIVVTENITLTAIWELIPPTYYTITFKSGIEGVAAVTQQVGGGVSTLLKENTFERENYTFAGWALNNETKKAYDDADEIIVNEDITLTALWSPIIYTITFNSDGGDEIEACEYKAGEEVDLSQYVPTKDGYTFAGWSYLDKVITKVPVGDIILKAVWIKDIITYQVIFEPNGGNLGETSPSYMYTYGVAFELPVPTKDGYSFEYWETEDGTVVDISKDIPLVEAYQTLKLSAVWKIKTYKVTFVNGESTKEVEVEYNSKVEEFADPVRDSYTFLGWYDSNGSKFSFDQTIMNDLTLEAKWQAPSAGFNVVFVPIANNLAGTLSVVPSISDGVIVLTPHSDNVNVKDFAWSIDGETAVIQATYEITDYTEHTISCFGCDADGNIIEVYLFKISR